MATAEVDRRRMVLSLGILMILAQLALRGWAVLPSYFFADDFVLLHQAQDTPLSADYLLRDFNSNLIPAVRLVASAVEGSGQLNWTLAALVVLGLQALASLACLGMLVDLFGARWGVLAPLALYLTSAATVPAFMWWVAAVSQLPFQICFFVSVSVWLRYLRSRRPIWLALTVVVLALALFCYTKALLVGPVLAFLAVAYFTSGPLRSRMLEALRSYWPAVLAAVLLLGGYAAYYATQVPQPFEEGESGQFLDVVTTFLATSLPSSLLGGPWQWWDTTPPVVLASPPDWAVSLSWVVIAAMTAYSALRRVRVAAGWLLLLGYGVGLAVLLASSRGQLYGALSGLEYRYLTDIVCVAALSLGLVFLPLRGAPGTSAPRPEPLLLLVASPLLVVLVTGAVAAGGVVSTVRYVHFWHSDNAAQDYVRNLRADLEANPGTHLAAQLMPTAVMPEYTAPTNSTPVFLELLDEEVSFPEATERLQLIDDTGRLRDALIGNGLRSKAGPREDCGWAVTSLGRTVPLDGETFDYEWWVRIGYLASQDSEVTVSTGDNVVETVVHAGVHSLFVRTDGVFGDVRISGLEPGTTMCVDVVEVGFPQPEGALQ